MNINADKYERSITLLCPVCGNSDFEHSEGIDMVKCIGCGREIDKDELIQENGVSVEANLDEIKNEIKKDLHKELNKMLKNAFKGSKNIRLK
ncbi:hypothetical protein RJO36_003314 [Enterobacter hormaechei]|nr:hypothetical protein [Enterobacter hormaechei]